MPSGMSPRRATGVAVAVLVAFDALLTGLASWRSWQMLGHLHAMVADSRARAIAAAAARGRHEPLPPLAPIHLGDALALPITSGVMVLGVGLLALWVARAGRCWAWLPMAALLLPFAQPMHWLSADQTSVSIWAGRGGQLLAVAVACATLLWLRPRGDSRRLVLFADLARSLAVPGVIAVSLAVVTVAGPNGHPAGLVHGVGPLIAGGLMVADRWPRVAVVAGVAVTGLMASVDVAQTLIVAPLYGEAPSFGQVAPDVVAAVAWVAVGAGAVACSGRVARWWTLTLRRPRVEVRPLA